LEKVIPMSGLATICLTGVLLLGGTERGQVYMADGIKIGEVRQDSAII
jgi:hypothetical protein